ncbi:MAG: Crp/Fnr family transcriptional regulator [Myxococcota bacterium]|nr:Crp/Fnr family transcriptional regulator [Myxococcota bacterium]
MTDFWHLHDLDWLEELSFDERETLRKKSFRRRYEIGQTVFMPTPTPSSVYLLESGLVRIYRLSESGLETSLGYVKAGEVFGELAVFGEYPRESFAQAVQASLVWKIPRRVFQPYVSSRPGLAFEVSKQIGGRLKRIESRVESLVFRDVRSRVVLILLELAEGFGREYAGDGLLIDVEITQAELATLVGSTRQSVNVCLNELTDQGLVGREGRRVVLLKPEELRRQIV